MVDSSVAQPTFDYALQLPEVVFRDTEETPTHPW
jgi:hypothetical protein